MQIKALIAIFLLCISSGAWAKLRSLDVEYPRAYGYTIGDVFEHVIRITVDNPWQLDLSSLPKDESIGIWFERKVLPLQETTVENGRHYQLTLRYQVFNAPRTTREVFIPRMELSLINEAAFKGGAVDSIGASEGRLPVFIREWGATLSPVTRSDVMESTDYLELQPAAGPLARSNLRSLLLALPGGIGVLFALTVFAYLFASLPGIRRTQGPFARALKRIRKYSKSSHGDAYPQALRDLHQAFDETAGRVVTGDELESFFAEHSQHAALREAIEQFFRCSHKEFFEPGQSHGEREISALLQLCRYCQDVERGLR